MAVSRVTVQITFQATFRGSVTLAHARTVSLRWWFYHFIERACGDADNESHYATRCFPFVVLQETLLVSFSLYPFAFRPCLLLPKERNSKSSKLRTFREAWKLKRIHDVLCLRLFPESGLLFATALYKYTRCQPMMKCLNQLDRLKGNSQGCAYPRTPKTFANYLLTFRSDE